MHVEEIVYLFLGMSSVLSLHHDLVLQAHLKDGTDLRPIPTPHYPYSLLLVEFVKGDISLSYVPLCLHQMVWFAYTKQKGWIVSVIRPNLVVRPLQLHPLEGG